MPARPEGPAVSAAPAADDKRISASVTVGEDGDGPGVLPWAVAGGGGVGAGVGAIITAVGVAPLAVFAVSYYLALTANTADEYRSAQNVHTISQSMALLEVALIPGAIIGAAGTAALVGGVAWGALGGE